MATKQAKLDTPEKVEMFKNYDDVMQRILAEAKREKAEIDHQILLKKQEYQGIVDSCVRRQNDFEQWKRAELERTNQEVSKRKNEVISREKMLSVSEELIKRKMLEADERERISAKLVDERNKVNSDRIEVEKLNHLARETNLEAQKMIDKAHTLLNQVSSRESQIKAIENKTNGINSEMSSRENAVAVKEKDLNSRLKNLEEVKLSIEPKISELKLIEENIKKQRKELVEEKNDVLKKTEEEKALLKGIQIREQKLKEKERDLLQKEEEIMRKALLAGIK